MSVDAIRCKFRLTKIETYQYSPEAVPQRTLVFTPQYDTSIEEDRRFARYTPSGEFRMTVDNPVALEFFKIGHDFYFDASAVKEGAK